MNQRTIRVMTLLAGVMLATWLFQWARQDGFGPLISPNAKLVAPSKVASASSASPSVTGPENLVTLLQSLVDGGGSAESLATFEAGLQRLFAKPGALPNESLLSFKTPAAFQNFLNRAAQSGLTVVSRIDGLQSVRVSFNSLDALASELLANADDYADVGANFVVQAPAVPTPEQRDAIQQAAVGNNLLGLLGVSGDHSAWGQGVTIAVLDGGVATGDPTLSGRVRALDIGLGLTPPAGDGHATAVASLVGGAAADAPGVAPSANILSIRVTGDNGLSDLFTLSQAIVAAADSGAQIINISMGSTATSGALSNAIDYAISKGAVLVASAGNDQAAQLAWPAADPRVISVGAVDALGQQDTFSNSGPQLKLTAPGYDVQAAWLDGQRVYFTGTSASAPVVSGALAAMISSNPGMTGTQALAVLQQYSSDGGVAGTDPAYGAGTVNLGWAMDRNNPARIDTAVSSHYYDATAGTMDFVVQNRSGQTVSGTSLSVQATSSPDASFNLPALDPGATYVVAVPVNDSQLTANGQLTFHTTLNNPPGVTDVAPANNRAASTLTAPTP